MLNDLTILDLTRHLPGPFATRMLADLGAAVIKIEEPGAGDPVRWMPPLVRGVSALFQQVNRNKQSLTLNLKMPEAKAILLQLVRTADVVVEGFRPGVTRRLGIDYDTLKETNEKLIYCSITAYGQDGPYSARAGHDINYIAVAGLLGLNNDPEGTPVIPPIQIADLASGALMSLAAILAALYAREKSGAGRYIDIAMLDGTVALLPVVLSKAVAGESLPVGAKMELTGELPFYNVYRTADGKFLSLGALEPKFWENFCRAIEREDFISRQLCRGEERERLAAEVKKILGSRTQAEWMRRFENRAVCCEPVNSLDEVMSHPQLRHRGMIQNTAAGAKGFAREIGNPLKMSGVQETPMCPAPNLGEHTEEILKELGYSKAEIANLKSIHAI